MSTPQANEEALFNAARKIGEGAERVAWLDANCPDAAMRARLEALLAVHEDEGGFLNSPVQAYSPTVTSVSEGPGSVIGPYKLLQQIGEGGFGVVYMAEQTEPVQRKVALKIIKPGMDTKEVIARFEAERQALALMDHPNIARVLDGGATGSGRPFFVMELVKGIPLTQFCDDNRFDARQRLELFATVCRAIQHAHHKGVIHRDVKPSNVLVTLHDGIPVPKVIDFGVSKAISQRLTEKTMFTAYGQMIGTPQYMSPEQAEMSGLDIDTRSDVYSLGVLLYELLTGTTPLEGDSLRNKGYAEMQRMIREDDPPRPSLRLSSLGDATASVAAQRSTEPRKLGALLRGELDWIVMKALEKQRERRYETANGFAQDIERFLNHAAVLACPPSLVYQFRKFARRHRAGLATGSLIGVILLVSTVLSSWMAVRATEAEDKMANTLVEVETQRDRAIDAEGLATERLAEVQRQKVEVERQKTEIEQERNRATAAEQEALREAAIAEAVNTFLRHDLLAEASPFREPDRNLTLREVLDRAAERVEGQFADQPVVEAAVRDTISATYRALGEYEKAFPHAQRALSLRRLHLGDDHLDTQRSIDQMADARRRRGEYDLAEALYTELLDTSRRVNGEDHVCTIQTQTSLALLYKNQGRHALAEERYLEGLDAARRLFGEEHSATLSAMNNLGMLYLDLERYSEAEPLFAEALEIRLRVLGDEHPHTLTTMNNLGLVYSLTHRLSESERLYRRALEIKLRVLGEHHPHVLTTKSNLAGIHSRMGRFDMAETLHTEVLEARRQALGADHRMTLETQSKLADVLTGQGRYEQAIELHEATLERRREVLGNDDLDTLISRHKLADLYSESARYDDGIAMMAEVLEDEQRVLGDEHSLTLVARQSLAAMYCNAGRLDEGERLLLESLEIQRRVLGNEHPKTLEALLNYSRLLLNLQRYDEAHPLLREYVAACEGRDSVSWQLFEARSLLGEALLGVRMFEEAEPLLLAGYEGLVEHEQQIPASQRYRTEFAAKRLIRFFQARNAEGDAEQQSLWIARLLDRQQLALGTDHPHLLALMNDLAIIFYQDARLEEAEPLLTRALQGRRRVLGDEHPNTMATLHNLAVLYCRTGREEEGERMLVELHDTQRRVQGAEHPRTLSTLLDIARFRTSVRRYEEVESTMREFLADCEQWGIRSWLVFEAQSLLGNAVLELGQYDEAESLLLSGYEGLSQHEDQIPGAERHSINRAVKRLISFYEARNAEGDAQQAAFWKARLPDSAASDSP